MKHALVEIISAENKATLFDIHCGEWFFYYPSAEQSSPFATLSQQELAVCVLDQNGGHMYYSPKECRFTKYTESERRQIPCIRIPSGSVVSLTVNLGPHEI